MSATQGKRVEGVPQNPGEYGKLDNGRWYACTPDPNTLLANLASHTITEHEDGTITVSPSILVHRWDGRTWHGWLERGIWREI